MNAPGPRGGPGAAGPIPFDKLFDPGFLASLSHLSIAVQRVAAGGRFGERLSRDLGAGIEFRDFAGGAEDDLPGESAYLLRGVGHVLEEKRAHRLICRGAADLPEVQRSQRRDARLMAGRLHDESRE